MLLGYVSRLVVSSPIRGSSPVPGIGVVGCQRSVSYVNLCYVSHVHASCDDSVVLAQSWRVLVRVLQ